jgi:hypothetical protein
VLTVIAWCWLLGSKRWRFKDARLLGERSVGCCYHTTTHAMRVRYATATLHAMTQGTQCVFLAASGVIPSHGHCLRKQANLFTHTHGHYLRIQSNLFTHVYWKAKPLIVRYARTHSSCLHVFAAPRKMILGRRVSKSVESCGSRKIYFYAKG